MNHEKSLNSKQSPINGVNKPFMGLSLFMAISVLMAPQILVSTKQKEYVMIAKDYEILKSDVEYWYMWYNCSWIFMSRKLL